MTRRGAITGTLALLGIALSVLLAIAASHLTGQRIGLASEPLSVAQGLAPHRSPRPAAVRAPNPKGSRRPPRHRGSGTTSTPAAPPAPVTTTARASVTTTAILPTVTTSAPVAPTTSSSRTPAVPATTSTTGSPRTGSSHREDNHRPDD